MIAFRIAKHTDLIQDAIFIWLGFQVDSNSFSGCDKALNSSAEAFSGAAPEYDYVAVLIGDVFIYIALVNNLEILPFCIHPNIIINWRYPPGLNELLRILQPIVDT